MFQTRVTQILGLKYPIIQGAMQWLSRAELVAAVSNAGGLGVMAALTFPTVKELRQEIKKTKGMTNKPFAVNVTLIPTRRPVNYEEYINATIEEGVNIIETSGRSPEPYMKLLKDAKVTVMHKCTRVSDVRKAERVGVDAVTIFGFEGGGHPGIYDIGSMVLIPAVLDSVKVPIIAAGGFGDARGFVAALALGAEGVLMGTRFMASRECALHPKIQERLLKARETDTLIIQRSIRNAARVIKSDFAQSVLEMEEKGATFEELVPLINGLRTKQALEKGDVEDAVMACGQIIGLIHDIPSVGEIIEGIISEAKLISRRLYNSQ